MIPSNKFLEKRSQIRRIRKSPKRFSRNAEEGKPQRDSEQDTIRTSRFLHRISKDPTQTEAAHLPSSYPLKSGDQEVEFPLPLKAPA